jgi:hypothetical protein
MIDNNPLTGASGAGAGRSTKPTFATSAYAKPAGAEPPIPGPMTLDPVPVTVRPPVGDVAPPLPGRPSGRARGRPGPVAWLAAAAVVLLAAIAAGVLSGGDERQAAQVSEVSPADDGTSSGGPATGGSSGGGGGSTRSSSDDEVTTSSAADDAARADVLPPGTEWILVLHSTEKALGIDEAFAVAAGFAGPNVAVIDSDAYVGLEPGYWVVVSHGYASYDDARADCAATFGIELGGSCYQRQIG